MTARPHLPTARRARGAAAALGATIGALALAAPSARAQDAASAALDPRWQAFVGCWAADAPGADGALPTRCIVPVGGSVVEIVTISDGKVSARERIDGSGTPVTRNADGCNGSTVASWSADNRRVYLRSDATCGELGARRGSGVIALADASHLVDVRGMAAKVADAPVGVRTTRWIETGVPSALPAEDANRFAVASSRSVEDARLLAAVPVGIGVVPEMTRAVDHEVAEGWLVASGQRMPRIDANRLRLLAQQGVPTTTLDVLVAMSYPQSFALNPSTGEATAREPQVAPGAGRRAYDPFWGWGAPGLGWGAFGFNGLGWGSPYYGWNSFGYNGLGWRPGWGGAWGPGIGWGSWAGPVVVIPRPSEPQQPSGRAASPRSPVGGGRSNAGDPYYGGGRSGSYGGGGGGASTSTGGGGSTSSGSGGGGGRTASPRP